MIFYAAARQGRALDALNSFYPQKQGLPERSLAELLDQDLNQNL